MDKTIYYKVSGGEPLEFCKDWLARRRTRGAEITEWAKEHGATEWVPGSAPDAIGGWAVDGLIFENDTPPDSALWKARKRRSSDGHTVFAPTLRSAAGKALAKEMQSMEPLPSMDEFTRRFNHPTLLSYEKPDSKGSCLLRPIFLTAVRIGWIGDEFWIAAPDVAAHAAAYMAEGYAVEPVGWAAPEGMEPLTRAHYDLALAQHEVAKLENPHAE